MEHEYIVEWKGFLLQISKEHSHFPLSKVSVSGEGEVFLKEGAELFPFGSFQLNL